MQFALQSLILGGWGRLVTDNPDIHETRQLARWQSRLLPFIIAAIALMAIFFFVSSLLQLARLQESVTYRPDTSLAVSIAAFERANPAAAADPGHVQWKALVHLEESVLRQRYSQVNATLLLRAWTRHLGFLTGMILAFVGAIFILAKLSERETRLSIESAGTKGALATTSPGIVLAVLGTALMVVTLTANFQFETRDVPVYLGRPAEGATPPPLPLPLDAPDGEVGGDERLSNQGETDAQDNLAR